MINLKKINKSCVAAVILAMCLMTSGCGSQADTNSSTGNNTSTTVTSSITTENTNVTHADDADNYKTEITGAFTITSGDGTSVTQNGSVYTITQAGEYTVSGLLSEGQIVVDAADDAEVTIILNGTSITCSTGSPIYIKNADNVKIKSEENTYNCVVDAREEASDDASDDAGNAAIYATCDLKFVGKGALSVTGKYNNGIQSKDDLSIKNVTIKVTAVNNAIKGNDAVDIESGEIIAISKKGDGIKTSNSSLSSKGKQKGIVTISGGNIDVYAACDGIDAAYGVDVSGDGNLNIYTDTYSEYSEEVTDSSTTNTSSSNSGNSSSNSSGSSKSSASASMMSYTTDGTSTSDVSATYTINTSSDNSSGITLTADTNNQNNGNMGTPPDMNNNQNNGSMGTPPDMNNNQNDGSMGTPPDMNNNQNSSDSNNNSGFGGGFGGGNNGNKPGDMNNSSGNSTKKSYSTKGIKADSEITISGATINISSTDDGIHANSDSGVLETGEDGKGIITVSGGSITISTGDDGIHADKELDVTDGYINVVTSYEGLEAMMLNISGGKVYVYATDDGLNACTGDGSTTPLINITGGYVDVTTASGDTDGIDSNGNYTQSGGMVLVKGGSSSGQVSGSIDVDGTVTVTGGICVALGGVCETPENSANAYVFSSLSFNTGSYSLKDASGNEVLSFTLTESYSNGWICASALTTGTEYTLYCDGNSVANWTQTSGTMGATNTGGFGGGFGGGDRGGNMNGNSNGNALGGNMNGNSNGNAPGGNMNGNSNGSVPGCNMNGR